MGTSLNAAARGTGPGYPALCSRSYPGRPDQVPQVRALLARVLDGCPAIEDAVLMADELAANAVLHSHSGDPGGEFTVRVEVRDGEWVRVEVTDEGGPTPPRLRASSDGPRSEFGNAGQHGSGVCTGGGALGAGGQGLQIVKALSSDWGVTGDVIGRTVWFVLPWGRP